MQRYALESAGSLLENEQYFYLSKKTKRNFFFFFLNRNLVQVVRLHRRPPANMYHRET